MEHDIRALLDELEELKLQRRDLRQLKEYKEAEALESKEALKRAEERIRQLEEETKLAKEEVKDAKDETRLAKEESEHAIEEARIAKDEAKLAIEAKEEACADVERMSTSLGQEKGEGVRLKEALRVAMEDIELAKEGEAKAHAEREFVLKTLGQRDGEVNQLNDKLSAAMEGKKAAETLRAEEKEHLKKEVDRLVQANTNLRGTISDRDAAYSRLNDHANLMLEELNRTKASLLDVNATRARLQEKMKKDATSHGRKLSQIAHEKDNIARQLNTALVENAALTDRLCTIKIEGTEGSLRDAHQGGASGRAGSVWERAERNSEGGGDGIPLSKRRRTIGSETW